MHEILCLFANIILNNYVVLTLLDWTWKTLQKMMINLNKCITCMLGVNILEECMQDTVSEPLWRLVHLHHG